MKKIVLFLALLLTVNCAFAQNEVAFIYINGANNNDAKTKKWFFDGIKKFHPVLKKTIEIDPDIKSGILSNGQLSIKNEPNALFWGDMSKNQLSTLKADLEIMDILSPKLAQSVRKIFSLTIYDAIWITKARNIHPVLTMLHDEVMKEYNNGNSVVLLGYSAGTFISYEYLLSKLPFIKHDDFLELVKINPKNLEYLKSHPIANTCIDALSQSNFVSYNIAGGLIANDNYEIFKDGISNLPDNTQKFCAPKGAIKGVINYASPIALFISNPSDPNFLISGAMGSFVKYMVENDIFWITVNYANDPMGFPTYKNLTAKELEGKLGENFDPMAGFFFDKSDVKSSRGFLRAHTSYWATSKKFSKLVLKAYKDGKKHFSQ